MYLRILMFFKDKDSYDSYVQFQMSEIKLKHSLASIKV